MASSEPQGYVLSPSVDEKNQLNAYLAENEAKGAPVHSFDPAASPSEKAAVAGKAESQLQPLHPQNNDKVQALPVAGLDTKSNTVNIPVPTVSIEDVDQKLQAQEPAPTSATEPLVSDGAEGVPGQLPAGLGPVIPDWYKIGWRAVGGIDDEAPAGEERDKRILKEFISDQYYGDWYHNAAIIVVAVVVTHFLTLFRFGWGWLIIVLAFCATYYTTSIERVRHRARDEIQRELTKSRLPNEEESAHWLNTFLDRFWLIYEPVLSRTIVASVEQVLSTSTPAFLDSLRLSTFSLGTKAPHIEFVHTYPNTEDDVVLMEWKISFTPNDVSNITPAQAAKKTNPKIVLEIRIGKGITAAMPILLEDIAFVGKMKIRMKLMTAFPHIQIVDLSFMEKPMIDYVLKPIGGETFGFDIASIPGLSSFIRDMVHATLGPMMYDPNVFTLNLEQLMSGVPIDAAIGVLQVTVVSGQGLRTSKFAAGEPDPYVTISVNNTTVLASTKWKESTRNPHWQETKFVLLNNLSGTLNLRVMDYNSVRDHDEIGLATWDLAQLAEDATHEGIGQEVLYDGKPKGDLKFDVAFYPVLKPQIVDGKPEPLPETSVGIVRLVIHQAKDLDPSSATLSKDLNPYCKVFLGHDDFLHSTPLVKHSLNPVWESSKEFLCADRKKCTITVKVVDDRDFVKDPVVGYMTITLDDLLAAKSGGQVQDWWPLQGCKTGRLRMSAEWKPLEMAGSLHGAASYQPPIGVVRMLIKRAADVKNVEGGLGGKSDPYVRVLVQNLTVARTEVVNNNLNPIWDQFIYIPVHSTRESMFLECMDYQHLTKDRSLGIVELNVSDLAAAADPAAADFNPKYPYKSLGVKDRVERIRLDATNYKGELYYTAEFIPAVHLKGVSFGAPKNEIEQALEGDGAVSADPALHNGKSVSNAEEDYQKIPKNITVNVPDSPATPKVPGPPSPLSKKKDDDAQSGIEIPKEELLKSPSGVVIFDVVSGHLAKRARLEILMDDGYWPVFGTSKPRSVTAKWDLVAEGFIKELDFGRIWLRLNENDEGERESIIAEFKSDAKDFLERALNTPTTFELVDVDGNNRSTVTIAAKFVPVPIVLSPKESINNQGLLRIDVLDGKDIPAVDRRGTSDPYVVFQLNDDKVHKTEVIKKTVTPVWNEKFEVSIPSRADANFIMEVYDWDQLGKDDQLGTAKIDLSELEPFMATEKVIRFSHSKHGDKGTIRLRLVFTPEIILKSRKNTSTFSSAGRAMTQIGSAPTALGRGVIGGVGSVGKGVKGIFKRDKSPPRTSISEVPEPPSTQVSAPVLAPAPVSINITDATPGPSVTSFPRQGTVTPPPGGSNLSAQFGILRVEIISAKDLVDSDGDEVKPYVVATIGEQENKTKHLPKTNNPVWNESLTFNVGPDTPTLRLEILDHRTFGKDKHVGETDIELWKHLSPTPVSPIASTVVKSELRQGNGLIEVRLEFEMATGGQRAASISSQRSPIGSPSRFSIRKTASRPDTDQ